MKKRQNLQNALDHLQIVTAERSLYRKIVDDCSTSLRSEFSSNGLFQPSPLSTKIPANSKTIKVHYSFDYAQMVHS